VRRHQTRPALERRFKSSRKVAILHRKNPAKSRSVKIKSWPISPIALAKIIKASRNSQVPAHHEAIKNGFPRNQQNYANKVITN